MIKKGFKEEDNIRKTDIISLSRVSLRKYRNTYLVTLISYKNLHYHLILSDLPDRFLRRIEERNAARSWNAHTRNIRRRRWHACVSDTFHYCAHGLAAGVEERALMPYSANHFD